MVSEDAVGYAQEVVGFEVIERPCKEHVMTICSLHIFSEGFRFFCNTFSSTLSKGI